MDKYGMTPRVKRVERMPRQEDLEAFVLNRARLEAAKRAYSQAWSVGLERGMTQREMGSFATDASRQAEKDVVEMLRGLWEESGIVQAR